MGTSAPGIEEFDLLRVAMAVLCALLAATALLATAVEYWANVLVAAAASSRVWRFLLGIFYCVFFAFCVLRKFTRLLYKHAPSYYDYDLLILKQHLAPVEIPGKRQSTPYSSGRRGPRDPACVTPPKPGGPVSK